MLIFRTPSAGFSNERLIVENRQLMKPFSAVFQWLVG